MNGDEIAYINELKNDNSAYAYQDNELGHIYLPPVLDTRLS